MVKRDLRFVDISVASTELVVNESVVAVMVCDKIMEGDVEVRETVLVQECDVLVFEGSSYSNEDKRVVRMTYLYTLAHCRNTVVQTTWE